MINEIIYENARARLLRLTPLPFDCGRLCGGACCKGDENSGMYLFPGEEKFYDGRDGYTISDSAFVTDGGRTVKLLVCSKPCKRGERPLSCRIFPLVPYYRHGSPVRVIFDPRASLCPIVRRENRGYISRSFIKEVKTFARYLSGTADGADFLEGLSDILDDYISFSGMTEV